LISRFGCTRAQADLIDIAIWLHARTSRFN
jgi:hypothetical protein